MKWWKGKQEVKIQIFSVGGTIDKIYFDTKNSYEVGPPNISEIIECLHLNPEFTVTSLMQKDSLKMSDEDRKTVNQAVKACYADKIIITHGTDTMVATASAQRYQKRPSFSPAPCNPPYSKILTPCSI